MESRPCSSGQKQAAMTPPSFLSGLEMRSAACDGPNGMRSRRGRGLVPRGDRSLAPQHPFPTRHDGLPVPLLDLFGSFFRPIDTAQQLRQLAGYIDAISVTALCSRHGNDASTGLSCLGSPALVTGPDAVQGGRRPVKLKRKVKQ